MTTVKPFDKQYEDRVLSLLNDFNSSKINAIQWRSIWENPWRNENEIPGYMLIDEDRVVGFLGFIYGSRIINGAEYRFCNMTSWIVKPEYRADSLKLVMPILKMKEYSITNLTPSVTVRQIIEKLGFTKIDNDVLLLPSIPFALSNSYSVSFRIDESILNESEKSIYSQNKMFDIQFGLIHCQGQYCLFAYKIRIKKGIKFCYILYISNSELFNKAAMYLRYKLFWKTFTPFVMIDSRLIKCQKMAFSFTLSGKFPKYFKTKLDDISEIDNLNTEFVLLNN